MQTAEDAAVVIAVVQTVKGLVPSQIHGWITVVVAGIVGAGIAFARNTDIIQGVVNGLVAVGAVTLASRVGK